MNSKQSDQPSATLSRRQFVASAAVALALPTLLTRRASGADAAAAPAAPAAPVGRGGAAALTGQAVIVEIANGRLQGMTDNGVSTFRGIPYAADTGGKNRWMAPQPVPNWTGVRQAVQYGAASPQGGGGARGGARGGAAPAAPAAPPPQPSEDCCVLNVQTASMDPNARRPVMLYIHGGGFRSGSGNGDSAGLARFGEVVVVNINHRLNFLGYLPLGLFDTDFVDAGNVGQLDILASLKWVQTNIRAFGGDPSRVTVFGQSGGGSKIVTMLAMPGARGLFHRAINMSGSSGFGTDKAALREPMMLEFLKQLSVDKSNVRKLQELPYAQLATAHAAAVAAFSVDDFRPVVDGRNVLANPISPEGLVMAPSIPMLHTMCADEGVGFLQNQPADISEADVQRRIKDQFGLDDTRAAAVMAGYRLDNPQRNPRDVLVVASSEGLVRRLIHNHADLRSAVQGSPNWVADFNHRSSGSDRVAHGADVGYAMGRVTAEPDAEIARAYMSAYATFAKTGNPNNPLLPEWKAYDTNTRPTMVFERPVRVVSDWRGGDRKTSSSLPFQTGFQANTGPVMRGP